MGVLGGVGALSGNVPASVPTMRRPLIVTYCPTSTLISLDPSPVLNTTSCPSTRKFTGKMVTSPPAMNPIRPTGTDLSSRKQSPAGGEHGYVTVR